MVYAESRRGDYKHLAIKYLSPSPSCEFSERLPEEMASLYVLRIPQNTDIENAMSHPACKYQLNQDMQTSNETHERGSSNNVPDPSLADASVISLHQFWSAPGTHPNPTLPNTMIIYMMKNPNGSRQQLASAFPVHLGERRWGMKMTARSHTRVRRGGMII